MLLSGLFGTDTAVKVLYSIYFQEEVYISELAAALGLAKSHVRKQLMKFENAGIVVGRSLGTLRIFSFNPRCTYIKELKTLLEKASKGSAELEKLMYVAPRRRPRRTGKRL